MRFVPPIQNIPLYIPNNIDTKYYTVVYLGNYKKSDYTEGNGSHPGVDIDATKYKDGKASVHCIYDGVVHHTGYDKNSWGNYIIIKHTNVPMFEDETKKTTYYSCYAHLSQILVKKGDKLDTNHHIGDTGSTGFSTNYHLHFQIDKHNAPFHPYWPFTTQERNKKGWSVIDAVNNGLGRENAIKYTINPMIYIQKYFISNNYPFSDIPKNSDLYDITNDLYNREIFTGHSDRSFRPYQIVNRAEAVKVLFKTFNKNIFHITKNTFKDVNKNDWFFIFVESARKYGYVHGYDDNTFRPANQVNRAEIAKMFCEFGNFQLQNKYDKIYQDVDEKAWYYRYVYELQKRGIVFYRDYFYPSKKVQRIELARMIYRFFSK